MWWKGEGFDGQGTQYKFLFFLTYLKYCELNIADLHMNILKYESMNI